MSDKKPNYLAIPVKDLNTAQHDALTRFNALTLELEAAWDAVRSTFGEPLRHSCDLCDGTGKIPKIHSDDGEGTCFKCKGEGTLKHPFPLVLTGIDTASFKGLDDRRAAVGWVSVRPCGKEYGDKTYLGWFLGDLALGPAMWVKDGTLVVTAHGNPAIFVPELGKVIYGCESWWGPIKSPEDLHKITDEDINNVWYVQALKDLTAKQEGE